MGDQARILYIEDLPGISEAWCHARMQEIPEFRREKALRLRFHKDRVQSVAAFCLLCVALGFVPQSFRIASHGKPFLPDGPEFSLSHSRGCAAAAISRSPVGVDVETVRTAPMEVCASVFTGNEQELLDSAGDVDRCFFALWTLKESCVKKAGVGLSLPLQNLDVASKSSLWLDGRMCRLTSYGTPLNQMGVCSEMPASFQKVKLAELDKLWAEVSQSPSRL